VKPSAQTSRDAAQQPAANPPPAGPRDCALSNKEMSARQRLLIGSGVAAGVVLLILLLLLLLDFAASGPAGGPVSADASGAAVGGAGGGVGTVGAAGRGSDAGDAAGSGRRNAASGAASSGTAGVGRRVTEAAIPAADVDRLQEPEPPASASFTLQRLDVAAGPPGDAAGTGKGAGDGAAGSEFFGVKADGTRFVYIVDCSGSMAGRPFQKACEELKDSVHKLRGDQAFYVYFFSSLTFPMFDSNQPERNLLPATAANVAKLDAWVDGTSARGGTEPQDALLQALELKPEAIFLLTDGSFDANVVDAVRAANRDGVVINTIGFMNPAGEQLLKQIAEQNRGTYRFVP
jgi:Mg-chelatase subunit ChlD